MASPLKYTSIAEIPGIVHRCRRAFNNRFLQSASQRKTVLHNIIKLVNENEKQLLDALHIDLRKHSFESQLVELSMIKNEAWETIDNLEDWMKPCAVPLDWALKMEDCKVQPDPLGVALIIGAWNYPVQLTFAPMIGAIAAGNTVVLKPSEVSTATATVLADLIPKYIAPDLVAVVNGGVAETTALLKERFDHIFYTGNSKVGKIVMKAAAENLTPVTLELGGKSPTIIDDTADLHITARRVMWGRVMNAGQTCIAPDYVLVKRNVKAKFIEELKVAREAFLGKNPQESVDFARIVNDMHYKRVTDLMKGGKVVLGGECDPKTKFIAPTVLDDVDLTHPLMTDEIFGPLLPLIPYDNLQEVLDFINQREKPLALYIFSNDKKFVDTVLNNTSSGGATVNDVLMHAGIQTLPFGGVGHSGMGAYHGKLSFDTFSHKKAVMRRKFALESLNNMRYPPYTEKNLNFFRKMLFKNGPARPWIKWVVLTVMVALVAMIVYFAKFYKKN